LSITQGNATAFSQSRLAAKAEVDQLLSYAASLGNTRFGDEFLFGGNRAGEAPLLLSSWNVVAPPPDMSIGTDWQPTGSRAYEPDGASP
jgi:hypothetical protein